MDRDIRSRVYDTARERERWDQPLPAPTSLRTWSVQTKAETGRIVEIGVETEAETWIETKTGIETGTGTQKRRLRGKESQAEAEAEKPRFLLG